MNKVILVAVILVAAVLGEGAAQRLSLDDLKQVNGQLAEAGDRLALVAILDGCEPLCQVLERLLRVSDDRFVMIKEDARKLGFDDSTFKDRKMPPHFVLMRQGRRMDELSRPNEEELVAAIKEQIPDFELPKAISAKSSEEQEPDEKQDDDQEQQEQQEPQEHDKHREGQNSKPEEPKGSEEFEEPEEPKRPIESKEPNESSELTESRESEESGEPRFVSSPPSPMFESGEGKLVDGLKEESQQSDTPKTNHDQGDREASRATLPRPNMEFTWEKIADMVKEAVELRVKNMAKLSRKEGLDGDQGEQHKPQERREHEESEVSKEPMEPKEPESRRVMSATMPNSNQLRPMREQLPQFEPSMTEPRRVSESQGRYGEQEGPQEPQEHKEQERRRDIEKPEHEEIPPRPMAGPGKGRFVAALKEQSQQSDMPPTNYGRGVRGASPPTSPEPNAEPAEGELAKMIEKQVELRPSNMDERSKEQRLGGDQEGQQKHQERKEHEESEITPESMTEPVEGDIVEIDEQLPQTEIRPANEEGQWYWPRRSEAPEQPRGPREHEWRVHKVESLVDFNKRVKEAGDKLMLVAFTSRLDPSRRHIEEALEGIANFFRNHLVVVDVNEELVAVADAIKATKFGHKSKSDRWEYRRTFVLMRGGKFRQMALSRRKLKDKNFNLLLETKLRKSINRRLNAEGKSRWRFFCFRGQPIVESVASGASGASAKQ